jgi:hypothetical protein
VLYGGKREKEGEKEKWVKRMVQKNPKEQAETFLKTFYDIRKVMSSKKKFCPPQILDFYLCPQHGLSVYWEDMRKIADAMNYAFKDCIDLAKVAIRHCEVCGAKMSYYGYLVVSSVSFPKERYPMLVCLLHTKESSKVVYQYYYEGSLKFFGEPIIEEPKKKFKTLVIPV